MLAGEEELDFVMPGPLPLEWQRSYVSTTQRTGGFGRGWSSPLELCIEVTPNGAGTHVDHLVFADALGLEYSLPSLAPGESARIPEGRFTLSRRTQGEYIVQRDDGTILWFAPRAGSQHRLSAMVDRNGNAIHIEFRFKAGQVESAFVSCSGGQLLQLQFSSARVQEVLELRRRSANQERVTLCRYTYTEGGNLLGVIDRSGAQTRTFEYDRVGRVARQSHADAYEARIRYASDEAGAKIVEQTDNVGQAWHYEHGVDRVSITDQDNRRTIYHYDAHGRWIGLTDPLGHFQWRARDALGNLRAIVEDVDTYDEVIYDDHGNPAELRDACGATTAIAWDTERYLPIAVTDPLGRTTKFDYDARGNLVRKIAPDGAATRFERDTRGLVVAIEDALGGIAKLAYNERAQLVRYVDCSGHASTLEYDDDAVLTRYVNALGEPTKFDYDAVGRLVRQTLADGTFETYRYDTIGRLVEVRDAANRGTRYRYAPDGQVVERIDALGHLLAYRYDSARRLIKLVNENGAIHGFRYDDVDRVVEEVRFDGHRTALTYNSLGFLDQSVEGVGTGHEISTRYQHDRVGRLLEQATTSTTTRFLYDDAGQILRAACDDQGVEVELKYDPCGRITEELTRAPGQEWVVRYEYDPLGNRLRTVLPDGREVSTLRYGSGHVHQISVDDTVVCDFERDALHREVARTQGFLLGTRRYDETGRLLQQASATTRRPPGATNLVFAWEYRYDPAGRLCAAKSASENIEYGYDDLSRLTRFNDSRFAFDPAHNLAPTDTAPNTATLDNRLLVHGDKRYRFDSHGRVVEKRVGGHSTVSLEWDDQGRLARSTRVERGESIACRYVYDAFGRRVAKQGAVACRFVWEGNRLLQTNDGAADCLYVYEPESFVPLARVLRNTVDSAGRIAYYHCDQIGLPKLLTDAAGVAVWHGKFSAWGRQLSPAPSTSSAANPADDQPLRYQGQFEDYETGLHYNRHRYYDPDVGRYLTPDPIGLSGGENAYQYAPNPCSWIDPYGLCKVYRVIRPDEDPSQGLKAKNPSAKYTPEGHVLHGSRPGFKSQFISLTKSLDVAKEWAAKSGNRIVEVDLSKVSDPVIDVSGPCPPLKGRTAKNWAKKSQEVLVEGKIPAAAIRVL